MNEPPSVLVVDDSAAQSKIVDALRMAGYRVTGVSTFEQATLVIATDPPNALITELRLGSHNGLHLVIRSRATSPDLVAIIQTAFPDAVLEAESRRLDAEFLVRPVESSTLLSILSKRLAFPRERRSTPRKRVEGGIKIGIASIPASLVDLSYEGFRVEFLGDEIPYPFEIQLPDSDLSVKAKVIWAHRLPTHDGPMQCGATVSNLDSTTEPAWRQIVDTA